MEEPKATSSSSFIKDIIDEDNRSQKHGGKVVTRFPPEPNGYLHIGHAKSICLNFGLAEDYKGRCHLRFDDTNPAKEEDEYVQSIKEDVRWLGFDWGEHLYYASDYFDQLYVWAQKLIRDGKAYVCELSADEVREYRGTLTEPGRESPYRNRSPEENLLLFEKMKEGGFEEGKATLRAKIDMASPNINLRDPAMYRVKKAHHHRTGDKWSIYPMYDWAHGQSDAIEGITHSICTLEFENHKPLYNWYLDQIGSEGTRSRPQQIEFARLNLNYTVMSKRKLLTLIQEKHVEGWDDPRMLTIRGLRRRGYTPASLRELARMIGVSKNESWIDLGLLEHCIREDLNENAERRMGVLRPLKVVITNYPDDEVEEFEIMNHPQKPELGKRKVPFCKELYIESEDFLEDPPKKFFRLAPGQEVRLRGAYFIRCDEVLKDDSGQVKELRCSYDPETRGGANPPDGRKVKGTLHWVSARHGERVTARLYDRLFSDEHPDKGNKDFRESLNPASLEVLHSAVVEPSLKDAPPESRYQLERLGYFYVDPKDSKPGAPVLHRVVTLKDSWAKEKGRG